VVLDRIIIEKTITNSGINFTSFVSQPASITIEWGGELIADGPNGGRITITDTGDGTNNGLMTMIGANNLASGSFRNQGSFTNACSGIMVFNGGMGTNTGSFRNEGTAVNSGNMDFNGGDGTRSGSLNNDVGSFTNHNTINFIAGGGSQAGVLIGVITEDPEPCPKIGGELLPIDTTALLIAGFQTNAIWMLPIVMSAVGIGAFVLTKKK